METEEEIESFLAAFALSPADTGAIIQKNELTLDAHVELAFSEFIQTLTVDFPPSVEMSAVSRCIFHEIFDHQENIVQNPDGELLSWIEMEYRLFRKIGFFRYGYFITRGFASFEQFIEVANMVLNRGKSRAGKSLEHHLARFLTATALPINPSREPKATRNRIFCFREKPRAAIRRGRPTT